jgi:hypothetical protein
LVIGFAYTLHTFPMVLSALVMGWIIAENNALQSRLAQ